MSLVVVGMESDVLFEPAFTRGGERRGKGREGEKWAEAVTTHDNRRNSREVSSKVSSKLHAHNRSSHDSRGEAWMK